MYTDPFADAQLDAAMWETEAATPYEIHPFGTLAVDALFAMGGSLPGSPLKGGAAPSPFSSPLRAPGSPAPATPTLTEAAAAAGTADTPSPAPAPAPVPTVTSIPVVDIQTVHASSGAQDVVVIAALRAAKRPAEEEASGAGGRASRRGRTDGDESDDSDASALSLERDDIMAPLVAAPLDSQAQVCCSPACSCGCSCLHRASLLLLAARHACELLRATQHPLCLLLPCAAVDAFNSEPHERQLR